LTARTSGERNRASRRTLRVAGYLGLAGAAGAIFFLATFISLHWLDPSISVVRNYVSDYANGPYGRLFQASLFVHGAGNLAIAGGLILVVNSLAGKWATSLFGLASLGVLLSSAFSADPEGVPRTIAGTIHVVAAFTAFPIEVLALIFFAHAFRRLPSWQTFAKTTIVIALFSIVFLLWLLVAVARGLEPGLPERASLIILITWEILVGARLAIRAALLSDEHL